MTLFWEVELTIHKIIIVESKTRLYLICVEQLIGSPGGIYFNLSLKTYHSIKVMLITLEVTSTLVNSTALFYLLLEVYFAFSSFITIAEDVLQGQIMCAK